MPTGLPLTDVTAWPNLTSASASPPAAECESDDVPAYARYKWMPVGVGIMAAGGSYPLMFAAISFTIEAVGLLLSPTPPNPTVLLYGIPIALAYIAIFGFVGICWSGFFALVVLPVFYLFAKSLKWRADFVTLGAICGGLVGFVSVLGLIWIPLVEATSMIRFDGLLFVFALGPACTTVLGQLGGRSGARRSIKLKEGSATRQASNRKCPTLHSIFAATPDLDHCLD